MSNVLIGIIGVILFIGLALAGALILGDDFRSANNSAKAATIISTIDQTANAINMYRLKTGSPYPAGPTSGLVPRFLKVGNSVPLATYGVVDTRSLGGEYSGDAGYVVAGGGGDPVSLSICAEIAQTMGLTLDADGGAPKASAPIGQAGCFRLNGTWGPLTHTGGFPIAYKRI